MSQERFLILDMRIAKMPGLDLPQNYWDTLFWSLTNFLQEHELVARTLAEGPQDITSDFGIYSDDLTDEGLIFLRKHLDKWMQKQDNGVPPDDVSYLEKGIAKMRR